MTKRLFIGAFLGLFFGLFVEIIVLTLSSVLSFVQNTRIVIPGVFQVDPDTTSGVRGLAFLPDFFGLRVVLVVAAVVFALGAVYFGARRVGSRQRDGGSA